ncbi:sodium:solute symporter family protein [bacterium]|nr:sodium:solute symporter family protein [bacterium]
MGIIDYAVLVTYFGAMVSIGVWAMHRVQGQEDYFMGGRGFGKLMQTFAAFGAGTGSDEPVRVGRTVWTSGLSGVWSALMWLFVTPIYWITAVWYRRMRHLTLGDWFVERYESRALGAAYTLFAIIFYMFYLSGMFSAIAKFAVPLLGVESVGGIELTMVLIPLVAIVVVTYGVLGGLAAAYWTDLIQGFFIILLSILLIPFGLWALVEAFGDPATQNMFDGFTILHERVSSDYFGLFSGPSAGEFPIEYIVSLTLLALVGIVVQPHFIAIGGGSAKSEDEARIGLVTGNFLKRLCTVGWALTALIALALLAGNPEIAGDPDRVWGVAAREILGPMNMGLVGLMLACLMAALMSSADTYMIVTSALVVRNVYAPYINPNASDKKYVAVARLTGLVIIVGAAVIAMTMADVFAQFKLALEIPILFAAPFWIGMYWRRANTTAVWITMACSILIFFIMPYLLTPVFQDNPDYAISTHLVTTTTTRKATPADVARHEAWVLATDDARNRYTNPEKLKAVFKKIGAEPPTADVGAMIDVTVKSGGQSIFWRGGVKPGEGAGLETVEETDEGNVHRLVQRRVGEHKGSGGFKVDFLAYHWLGADLSTSSKATLQTLRLPPRLIMPFLILIFASLLTKRNSDEALDRYYAKMKTEVDPDPVRDREKLEQSYKNPSQFEDIRLFPGTDFEFIRPRRKDIVGFAASVVLCCVIVLLLLGLVSIGS